MEITINLNSVKTFTEEHIKTYKKLNPKAAYPWLFGDDLPESFELINEATLLDYKDVNWLDSETKLLTQFARAGGANPEEKNIAYNIADFGFKLGPNKPAAATLCLPNNTFIPLNGRTRRKIITSNYKKITNFITVLYRIKDKYVEADGTLSKQAQSDISIFGVSSNTSEDPQGTTTTADVTREVMLAIKNEWISKDKDSISARVNKLCGKGVFRQETRDKLTQIIYNRFTDEDKVLPWSEAAVKVWREENKFKDADWKEPKKVGNKEYDGIIYVIVSSSTLEKSVGVVARIAKDNPTKQIRVVIHTGVLKGAIAEDNFLEKVNNFRNVFEILLNNLSFAFFSSKPASVGIDNRICLYGVLPAIQKYHDLTKVIKFVKKDDKNNPHGLEQSGVVLAHTPPATEEQE